MTYTSDQLPDGLDAAGPIDPLDLLILQQNGDSKVTYIEAFMFALFVYEQISDPDPLLTPDSDDFLPTKSAVKEYVDRHFSILSTISGTTHNIDNAEAGQYLRFTSGSAKTVTFRDDATHALDDNVEFHIRNVGADLTLTAGTTDVVLNEPFGGTLVLSDGMTVTVKRVAADEFDVIGQTVSS